MLLVHGGQSSIIHHVVHQLAGDSGADKTMSLPSSSSAASSPSFSRNLPHSPEQEDLAETRFNPLFIHTGSHASGHQTFVKQSHSHNQSHSHSHYSPPNNLAHTNIRSNSSIASERSTGGHNKLGNNSSSCGSMQPPIPPSTPSRKVQVIYYLSRSGQLEHPHLLEVTTPPNQGLYLRDVKRRLAVIRGKRLPSSFAWSYKRSYKNGYVWQDLCDDDLIFPAHGCEYVLKGSEILHGQRDTADEEEPAQTSKAENGQGVLNSGGKEDYREPDGGDRKDACRIAQEESARAVDSACLHVNMVENGTDAATQTEEDLGPATEMNGSNEKPSLLTNGPSHNHHDTLSVKHASDSSPNRVSCTASRPENAVELNNTEFASPPSSSSATNSPSPYKEIASTSSSSASGFTAAKDCCSIRESNREHGKAMSDCINPGSKTPGRPWMKKAIQKLEEQGEILRLHGPSVSGAGQSCSREPSSGNKNVVNRVNNRRMCGNSVAAVIMEEADPHSAATSMRSSKGKHSNALSLLQFMSCGGLDVKEQILPMSLYRLRSRGTPAAADQLHMSTYAMSPEQSEQDCFVPYGSSETSNLWSKISKSKSLCLDTSVCRPPSKASVEFANDEYDVRQAKHHSQPVQGNSLTTANGSSTKSMNSSMPDVISIGRSSKSDSCRSITASHEFECDESDRRLRKREDMLNNGSIVANNSSRFSVKTEAVSIPTSKNETMRHGTGTRSARALSGEILLNKGSPLFVPGKRHLSYSGTPLNYVSSGITPPSQLIGSTTLQEHPESGINENPPMQDEENKAVGSRTTCNPSTAFSEDDVNCVHISKSGACKSGEQKCVTINGYDRSMAQIWEELLAAPMSTLEEKQQKDGDFPRVRHVTMGSGSTWEVERTLQNAVELSLQPPLENHLLHVDCP
ncbi:hypothetical protein KP509_14G059700 [Ceratopteris richardii]|nr:hypothetical protein KP509_14G059700 [Ceratopteris richardii]